MDKGKLYICPTPIGNLEDISLRTLKILKEVDLIAAEDTRHTIKLLNHFKIKKPLTSYHEHNEKEKSLKLLDRLNEGINIALVSDAGMPGISDPGQKIIASAIKEGVELVVLPGPSASITALVASGLPSDKFVFEGFLSSKKSERLEQLKALRGEKRTIILYESPYRLLDTLEDILDTMGDRRLSIAKEITKIHEEFFRGKISQVIGSLKASIIKGEFVLVLEGSSDEEETVAIDIKSEIKKYLNQGYSKKASIKIVAEKHNLARNLVYKESLNLD